MAMFITMARVGQFQVESYTGHTLNKCGNRDALTFDYRCEIDGDSDNLTVQGFIIDNFAVANYFIETFKHIDGDVPSCEMMAIRAVDDLCKLCEGRATRVQVTVDGTGVAGLTARWVRTHDRGPVS